MFTLTMNDKRPLHSSPEQENGHDTVFQIAFGPLGHHLFPDGCPQSTEEQHEDNNEIVTAPPDVSTTWPSRQDRTAISSKEAAASIASLTELANETGLTCSQIWCVCLAACETLPENKNGSHVSALVDGTCKHFCSLVRCMIPSRSDQQHRQITSALISRLLSIRCAGDGRLFVLRFLTLALRSGCLVGQARETLSHLYGVIFSMVSDPKCCMDAVRLLHAITRRRHVRIDRAKRLRAWYDKSSIVSKSQNNQLSPIWLLLQLYARYDPSGCGSFFSSYRRMGSGAWSRCFHIPDEKWEQAFRVTNIVGSDALSRPEKRVRVNNDRIGATMSYSLEWLDKAFDGVHSFSWGLAGNRSRNVMGASDLLSDERLQSVLILATNNPGASSVAQSELIRLQACLPYMLHEEWYHRESSSLDAAKEDADMNSHGENSSEQSHEDSKDKDGQYGNLSDICVDQGDKVQSDIPAAAIGPAMASMDRRMRLLRAMASMATQIDSLLPEIENFLLDEILPNWDGSDKAGLVLCHELLPKLTPMSFSELNSSILRYLAQQFVYGPPGLQYAIVTGALSKLLERWERLDWARAMRTGKKRRNNNDDPAEVKQSTLEDLIQWTDRLLLKGFLVNDAHELLRQASLGFFDTASRLCREGGSIFLGAPSPALMYRFLLSPSALSVDKVCGLLVNYKSAYQQLKSADEKATDPRIAIFNCFLWDFCTMLWRCSPLPALDDPGNQAHSKSILFTDLSPILVKTLYDEPNRSTAPKALSITHGAIFCGYATDFCERHKLSSVDDIQGKIKVRYLEYLRECHGLEGLYAFLTTFVGSLASREARKQVLRQEEVTAHRAIDSR